MLVFHITRPLPRDLLPIGRFHERFIANCGSSAALQEIGKYINKNSKRYIAGIEKYRLYYIRKIRYFSARNDEICVKINYPMKLKKKRKNRFVYSAQVSQSSRYGA